MSKYDFMEVLAQSQPLTEEELREAVSKKNTAYETSSSYFLKQIRSLLESHALRYDRKTKRYSLSNS